VAGNSSVYKYTGLGASMSENGNRAGFRKSCFEKLDDGQSPPHKRLSVKFSRTLLDFLTFEDGAGRLCHNICNDLPLLCNIPQEISHDDLVMQALVRPSMARFRATQFGAVQFGTSYTNLRSPHTFKCQIQETPLSRIQVNMVHMYTLQVRTSTSVIYIHYIG